MFIALKPKSQRDASADQVIARLRTNLAKIQGITLYMQAAQDITIGGRVSTRPSISTRWTTPTPANSITGRRCSSTRSRSIPGITDVATDQLNAGPLLDITINRDVASSYGILPSTIDNTLDDAFGQRIVSTMYTTLNQYHVVLEVDPKFQYGPGSAQATSMSTPRPASRCRYARWSTASSRWRRSWSTIRASSRR